MDVVFQYGRICWFLISSASAAGGHSEAVYQSPTPRQFMPGPAQRARRDRLLDASRQIGIKHFRETEPKAVLHRCCAAGFAILVCRNDHGHLIFFIPPAANVLLSA
jgi:hypothetical protein